MSQNQNNQQSPKDLITGIVSIIIAIVFVVLAFSSCNGDSSSSSSSSGGRSKCAFKQNGRYVCSSPAKRGSNFCSYHQNYLDDAYNTFFDN